MAKRNEGDIMEGIFSIGLADLFANNNVSRSRVNTVRAKIDTNLFSRGAFNYEYSSKEVPPDPDIVKINLQVRLKQGSTWEAYGPEWKMMYDRVGDIGNLDNKITQIINTLNTNYREKIIKSKNVWLTNNKSDNVVVDIIADGIEGEQSGGEVKGDIMVKINMNGENIIDEEMIFSLKSGSTTVANLSPYTGLLDVISSLGVDLGLRETKYRRLLGELLSSARTPAEKRAKIKLVQMFYADTMTGIDAAARRNPSKFKKAVFNMFRRAAFGTDLADVIDVDKTKIKEMTLDRINELESTTGNIRVAQDAAALQGRKFYMTGANAPKGELMSFRFKKRIVGSGDDIKIKELKFYIMSGTGAYLPKQK